ncbi:MAG: hypothetical protein KMY50_05700, partial [Candidatus Desulforudis sp.]|nr:hypothetical protein [Desulforudis sp.]
TGLAITPPSGGLSITPPAGGLSITSTGLALTPPADGLSIPPPAGGLPITRTGLSISPPSGGLSITQPAGGLSITSTGLAITPPADGLSITPPVAGLLITSPGLAVATGTTDVSYQRVNFTDTAGSADVTHEALGVRMWTFGVVNDSLAENAQAEVKMQVSPDGETWQDEVSTVTISQNSLATFVPGIFLKYARLFYKAVDAASPVTLNIYFQGQL